MLHESWVCLQRLREPLSGEYAQLLHGPKTELRRAIVDCAVICGVPRGVEQIGQRLGTEERPVLSTDEEQAGRLRSAVVHAREGQAQAQIRVANGGDVGVIRFIEVTFEIRLESAGDGRL